MKNEVGQGQELKFVFNAKSKMMVITISISAAGTAHGVD